MTAYSKLISLKVKHDYYQDNLSADLYFNPVAGVKNIFKNQRWLSKVYDTGFSLICQTDVANKPVIGIGDITLHYGIGLRNAAKFSAVTILDQTAPAKAFSNQKKMYFCNDALNEVLKYTILDDIIPDVFSLNFSVADVHTAVTLRVNSAAVNNHTIEFDVNGAPVTGPYHIGRKTDKTFSKLLEMRHLPDGLYTISVKNAADTGADIVTFTLFKSTELAAMSIFGVLELTIPASNAAITETKFSINFKRKSTTWKYFVVNQSGIDLDDFDILLKDKSNDGTPDGNPVYGKYNFSGNPPAQPIPDPLNNVAGTSTLLFASTVKIPFFETVKTGLKLIRKEGGTEVVLSENLPNPIPEKQAGEESKIYVYV
ncbi:MAG TPA: hypothetical protein VK541_16640 [Pedobacter sp.]|uniref:hypothetical protein n=1 Tax=Pedobacter sp. TaxID=1411316 RepID=UPI002C59E6B4|nr:hypothetical protein [Pedobacter sp.]HMI04117.1 hypothetical protein [Pedobacter sp.]